MWWSKPKAKRTDWNTLTATEELDIIRALFYAVLVSETVRDGWKDPGYLRLAERIKADPVTLKRLKEAEKTLIYCALLLTSGSLRPLNPPVAKRLYRMQEDLQLANL